VAPTAPVAVADSYSIDEDTVLAVSSPGILLNDSDDADSFAPEIISTPTHGDLSAFESTGAFTYEPDAGFGGSDSFTYKDVDSWQESSVVTVDLTINARADVSGLSSAQGVSDPTLVGITVSGTGNTQGVVSFDSESTGSFTKQLVADTYSFESGADGYVDRTMSARSITTADTAFDSTILRAGDSDGDNDVTSSDVSKLLAAFVNGLASSGSRDDVSGNTVDLNNDDVVDAIDISLAISNYGLQGPMAWETVATTPPLVIEDSYWVYLNSELIVGGSGVLGNDFDQEGDSLTATLVDSTDHGSLVLDTDGSFTYEPDAGYVGADSFSYYPSDAQTTGVALVVEIEVRSLPSGGTTVGSTVGTTVGSTTGTTVGG
jgi:large repetitive protein